MWVATITENTNVAGNQIVYNDDVSDLSQNFSSAPYVSTSRNATLFITTIKSHTEYAVFFKHYLNLFHSICNLFRVGKKVINKEKNNFNNYHQIILTIR